MNNTHPSKFLSIGYLAAGFLATAVAIYLTPLRHVNVIPNTVNFINPKEFYDDYRANPNKYLLVDIRPEFLRYEYPEGAMHISIFRLSEEWKKLPRSGKTIVIFCEESISESVAYGYLQNQGFLNIKAINGGRAAWKDAGLPLVKNPNYAEEATPFLAPFQEGGLLLKLL